MLTKMFFLPVNVCFKSQNIQMRTKMLEARFHEEKLRLQQKHDSAVQKVIIQNQLSYFGLLMN